MEHLMKAHKDDVLNTFEKNKQLQIEIERLKSKCMLLEQSVDKEKKEKEELIKKEETMQQELNQLNELNDQFLWQIKNQEDQKNLEQRMQILNGKNQNQKIEQQNNQQTTTNLLNSDLQEQNINQQQTSQILEENNTMLVNNTTNNHPDCQEETKEQNEKKQQELFTSIFTESLMLDETSNKSQTLQSKQMEQKINQGGPLFKQFPFVEEKFVKDEPNAKNLTPWLNIQTNSYLPDNNNNNNHLNTDLSSFEKYQEQQNQLIQSKLQQEKVRSMMMSNPYYGGSFYGSMYPVGQPNMMNSAIMPNMNHSVVPMSYNSQPVVFPSAIPPPPPQQQFNNSLNSLIPPVHQINQNVNTSSQMQNSQIQNSQMQNSLMQNSQFQASSSPLSLSQSQLISHKDDKDSEIEFKGHTGEIIRVIWVQSIQGHYLIASCSYDKTIRVWDLSTKKCVQILAGHRGEIKSLQYLHSKKQFVSSSLDGTIRFWNIQTGQCIRVLKQNLLQTFILFEKFNQVVIGQSDGRIKSFQLENDGWENQANIEEEVTVLTGVQTKGGDQLILVGGKEGKISLIDPDFQMKKSRMFSFFKSKIIEEKKAHKFQVMNIEWIKVMNLVITCGKTEENIKLWFQLFQLFTDYSVKKVH